MAELSRAQHELGLVAAAMQSLPGEVARLNNPFYPPPVRVPEPQYPEPFDPRTRRFLWITIAAGITVALTHHSLTVALASAHHASALRTAHAMLTWPLPMTQPVVAGVGAFVLLGFAVQTAGWRRVSVRQGRLLMGFAIATVFGAGPMVLFCVLTALMCVVLISLALVIILILFLLLLIAR